MSIDSCAVTSHHWEELDCLLHSLTSGICMHWWDVPELSVLHTEQSLALQPILVCQMFQSLNCLCGPSVDSLQHVYAFLVLGIPELDPLVSHQYWVERKDYLPWHIEKAIPNVACKQKQKHKPKKQRIQNFWTFKFCNNCRLAMNNRFSQELVPFIWMNKCGEAIWS